MSERRVSAVELAVLEALLPEGLTPNMRDVAQFLFEALVLLDARCGQDPAQHGWREQLLHWAQMVCAQLQHLADNVGGEAIYMAKGITVHLSARDRRLCAEFRGDYKVLARKYGLSEMRVRQIVDAWQRENYLHSQRPLPGMDNTEK